MTELIRLLEQVAAGATLGEEIRVALVRLARIDGATWHDIGGALGMSRQAAHKHYGPLIGDGYDDGLYEGE